MPIYDYICAKCGKKFEQTVSVNAEESERLNQKCECGEMGTRNFNTQKKIPMYMASIPGFTRRKF